jgi:hypothetical protein
LQAVLTPSDGSEQCILDGGISELHDAANRFHTEVDLIKGEMDRFSDCYRAEGEGTMEVLQRLVEDGREMASCLEEELKTTLVTARQLLGYFGERQQGEEQQGGWANENYIPDAMTYTAIEKFFCTIREFVGSFEDCWRDVIENPKKLRLEGVALSTSSTAAGREGSDTGSSATSSLITKQSPKAKACSKAVAQSHLIAAEIKARQASSGNASADGQCASGGIAPEACAAMRRRKSNGMMRDFGSARLLPPGIGFKATSTVGGD